jgi:hypothetical protein
MDTSFVERWRSKSIRCGFGDDCTVMISCEDAQLPRDAAPFLSFGQAIEPVPIWQAFGSPSDWSVADRERFAAFRIIGHDGAGSPICIGVGGKVLLLDHDEFFRTQRFVNTSVKQLSECLLAYMGEEEPEQFRSAVRAIEPAALAEGSFWELEAAAIGE